MIDQPYAGPCLTLGIRIGRDSLIEGDVWTGSGATITDGVRMRQGAVVGAGAVVTRDVPPHAVAARVSAKIVRGIDGRQVAERGKGYL